MLLHKNLDTCSVVDLLPVQFDVGRKRWCKGENVQNVPNKPQSPENVNFFFKDT